MLLVAKLLLVFDVLVGLVNINMSSWKSLNSNERNQIKIQLAIAIIIFLKTSTIWRVAFS